MAISRGSVRHRVVENVLDYVNSFFRPGDLLGASELEQVPLKTAVEKMFPGQHVTVFPFARTCLHAVLTGMHLPPKSKILMTPITIGPMVEVIESLGHEVVFVDIETDTFGPSLEDLKKKIQAGASCFLLTHLFGYVSRVDEALKLCREAGVRVIEDISHNLGSELKGVPLGAWGDVAIYSASLLKYVDGYNGAFTITKHKELGVELDEYSQELKSPDARRVRAVVLKTLIWNVALGRWIFKFGTWPALKLLKLISHDTFERLLGPGIPFVRSAQLPSFYFEQVTVLQCRVMLRNLIQLPQRLRARKEMANRLIKAIESFHVNQKNQIQSLVEEGVFHTYWQFVLPVQSTQASREALFSIGVETNTTNLRDLAFEDGIELLGARSLKENFIFIPLHSHLSESDYKVIIKQLLKTSNFDLQKFKSPESNSL